MPITSTLLDLSNTLLITIIIGYVGYFISYHGFKISADDKFYKILLFSLPSILIFHIPYIVNTVYLSGISLIITVVLSVIWRKWGKKLLKRFLSKLKISNSNDNQNVQEDFEQMLQEKDQLFYMQVHLMSGNIYESSLYNKENTLNHIETFSWDNKGNLLMYVDRSFNKEKKQWTNYNSTKDTYNTIKHILTYIPRENIKLIRFTLDRYK